MSLISDISTGESLVRDLNEIEKEEEKRYLEQMEEDAASGKPVYRFHTRDRKRIEVRLTDQERANLVEEMSSVAVHDFGDLYHLTDEERQNENRLYEVFMSIQNVKTKYKKLDEYVRACRKIMNAIKEVAAHNMVYDPEEFVKKTLAGEIIITGINFPKYSVPKKKRREVNWMLVAQMIENPDMDESLLVQRKKDGVDQYNVVLDPEAEMEKMFGITYEQLMKDNPDRNVLIEDEDNIAQDVNVVVTRSIQEISNDLAMDQGRKEVNSIRDMFLELRKESLKKTYDGDASRNVANAMYDDIARIRSEDEERDYFRKKKDRTPVFEGNIMKADDVSKFEYDVDEYLDEHATTTNYRGTTMTKSEMEEEKLKEYLESCGLNVRKFYQLGEREKEAKRAVARQNRRMKKIKDRMIRNGSTKKKVEQVGFSVRRVDDDTAKVNTKKKKKNKKGHKRGKELGKMLDRAFESKMDDYDEYRQSMMADYDD